ncbi:carboxymuconolactone decarboxylase family protein [Azospirillum sp.]|uniref:carboxymuconolactone decarboxylase family protein n=1 Tax=Azospirillum sp. TaxID=34012 RepID=UPI002D5318AF|nr:carboxymuconolactone decarboxylase family protein [Azospirillum sp.]HYD68902.1 carboxymuconolactone decarboxylase family protein [Azospirillum sp.]
MSTKEEYEKIYTDLIGFVPPRIQQRIRAGLECDPELLDMVEKIREKAMYPADMDVKVAQMILFGILLSHVAPAAEYHGRAAMRAGATKKELHDVAGLAFLFRGLPAFNLAGEILNKIYDEQAAAAPAAAE